MAKLIKPDALSWKCERGFSFGLICAAVIAVLWLMMSWLAAVVMHQPLLAGFVILLYQIILFAGMKIGGAFAAAAGIALASIFVLSMLLTVEEPWFVLFLVVTIAMMLIPLRLLLITVGLRFAAQYGWFGGENIGKNFCSAVVVFTILNFVANTRPFFGFELHFAVLIILESVGCIIGFWIGKQMLKELEARAGN